MQMLIIFVVSNKENKHLHIIKIFRCFFNNMENEERKKLEEEYKNLKLLIEFHSTYGVLEKSEYEKMVNDILDRMNEIRKMLEKE